MSAAREGGTAPHWEGQQAQHRAREGSLKHVNSQASGELITCRASTKEQSPRKL